MTFDRSIERIYNARRDRAQPMAKTPDIGFNDPSDYFFLSLCPAYERFEKQQTRANAIDFASVAWNLCERLWYAQGKPDEKNKFIEGLFGRCPELHWMHDIAETEKHPELDRTQPPVNFAKFIGAENPGGIVTIRHPFGNSQNYSDPPKCTLEIVSIDGSHHYLPDVLKRVFEFWKLEVNKPNP